MILFAALLCGQNAPDSPENLNRLWKGEFASARPLRTIRVVDWNIDRGKRLTSVAAELERENPDLCLLQEVDLFAARSGNRNISEELARRLKLNYVFAPEFQELSQGTSERPSYQGQAILTRLPIRSVRVLRFREQSGFWKPRSYLPHWSILQRRLGGRLAMAVELEFAGGMLVVYNAHLESRSFGRIQSLQLDEILADARRYPASTPIVLAGDLNTKYNAAAFAEKLRKTGWRSVFGNRLPRTHLFVCSLDWVLVHGPLEIAQAKVVRGVGASDHFPIFAALSSSASQSTSGL